MPVRLAQRKSPMVGSFINHLPETVCPSFKKLSLSLGCGYSCSYCYLRLTLRQQVQPGEVIVYTNEWKDVERQLYKEGPGVYNAGELADSLNPMPKLLPQAIKWFNKHHHEGYTLLLCTKSEALGLLQSDAAPPKAGGVIVSFSVNAPRMAELYEKGVPTPQHRLEAVRRLLKMGFRVRIRLDPIILDFDSPYYEHTDPSLVNTAMKNLERDYKDIVEKMAGLAPPQYKNKDGGGVERVTIGTLRAHRNLPGRCPDMKWFGTGLDLDLEGNCYFNEKRRYFFTIRAKAYKQVAEWLSADGGVNSRPAVCKETFRLWSELKKDGWHFQPCNCME